MPDTQPCYKHWVEIAEIVDPKLLLQIALCKDPKKLLRLRKAHPRYFSDQLVGSPAPFPLSGIRRLYAEWLRSGRDASTFHRCAELMFEFGLPMLLCADPQSERYVEGRVLRMPERVAKGYAELSRTVAHKPFPEFPTHVTIGNRRFYVGRMDPDGECSPRFRTMRVYPADLINIDA